VWGGDVPLPTGGEVWGGGCAASPENFFSIFELKKTIFGAFWVLFFAVEWKLVRPLSGTH